MKKMNRKEGRKIENTLRKGARTLLSYLLIVSMVLGAIPITSISDISRVFAARRSITPTLKTTISVAPGEGVTRSSDGYYVLANGAEMKVTVSVDAQNLPQGDKLSGVYAKLGLCYLDENNMPLTGAGNLDKGHGGVYARVINDGDMWQDTAYVQGITDPDNTSLTDPTIRYTGNGFRLDLREGTFMEAGQTKVFDVVIGFLGNTAENAVISIPTIAGYQLWYQSNPDAADGSGFDISHTGFESDPQQESTVTVVNSNLLWNAKVTPLTGANRDATAPVMWAQYNYQDVLVEIANVSEKEEPYFEEYEFPFKLQHDNGVNGILDKYMTSWFYNEGGEPIQNPDPSEPGGAQKYVGVLNQGGLLIYDVTGENGDYDLNKATEALPYTYTSQGIGSVHITKEQGGTVYSPSRVEKEPDKFSKRYLLFRIPFPNNFSFQQGYAEAHDKFTPTVFFGTPQVSLSRTELNCRSYFQEPKINGSLEKTVQQENMYIGQEAYYTLSKITNTGNIPVFSPYIIDTLPESFDLTGFSYVLDLENTEELAGFDILDVFESETPAAFEVEDADGNLAWVDLGTLEEDVSGAEPGKRIWKLTEQDKAIQTYLDNHPDSKLTHRIRIQYAYNFNKFHSDDVKLDRGEVIPGTLYVYGIPRKNLSIRNTAELYFDYERFVESSSVANSQWKGVDIKAGVAVADKTVSPPELWTITQGLFDDGQNREEGNPLEATLNSTANGYTVRLGIENDSDLTPGIITLDIPRNTASPADGPYSGFETAEIRITKDMLQKLDIEKLEILTFSEKVLSYSKEDLQNKLDGEDILLKEETDWLKEFPVQIKVYFSKLEAGTKKPEPANPGEAITNQEDPALIQLKGSYSVPGNPKLTTTLESAYEPNDGQTAVTATSEGELNYGLPDPVITANGFVIEQIDGTEVITEANPAAGLPEQNNLGYIFRIGSANDKRITPGYLNIELPANTEEENWFRTSEILLRKEMLNKMKLRHVEVMAIDGTKTKLTREDLGINWTMGGSGYMTFEEDIVIPESAWEGIAKEVKIYFDYYQENSAPDTVEQDDAYVRILGIAHKEGLLEASAKVTTDYQSAYVEDLEETADGSLQIEAVNPTIEMLSHTEQEDTDPNHTIQVQHGSTITVPADWDAYYTAQIGNDTEHAPILSSKVTVAMNNRVRTPGADPYGFMCREVVIPADYMSRFIEKNSDGTDNVGIEKIVVTDSVPETVGGTDYRTAEFTLADADRDENGNYILSENHWKAEGIQYPKQFDFHLRNFKNKIAGDDCLTITFNGKTDWYTWCKDDDPANKQNSAKWEALQATGTFATTEQQDVHEVSSTAKMEVPVPKPQIAVEYANFYEHEQGQETLAYSKETLQSKDAVGSVDGKRNYLAVPYERMFTQRFAVYQPSISTAENFTGTILLPINPTDAATEPNRGFHATEMLIKAALMDESLFRNFELTLYDATDESKYIVLESTDDPAVLLVTDSRGGTAELAKDAEGNVKIARAFWEEKGILSLGKLVLTGNEFKTTPIDVESKSIEISGFSDSDFGDGSNDGGHNDITEVSADTYIRGIGPETPETSDYLARWVDEGRLLVSKMYFDTQIKTGYTTERYKDNGRYEATGVPNEHKRTQRPAGSDYAAYYDNTQLEVGYKSLTSISVDFRQYLNDYTTTKPAMDNDFQNGHAASSGQYSYATDRTLAKEEPMDGDKKPYVKSYAYNTKAELELTVNLPAAQGYEAYYLKLDPRAVKSETTQYLNSIDIYRQDGSVTTVNAADLVANSRKWNDTTGTKDWYRVNLLTENAADLFSDNMDAYYRDPADDMSKTNISPVVKAVFHISINGEEAVDGKAAAPDFGSWVSDVGMDNQHMYEFVGRMNTVTSMKASASAKLTIGDRTVTEDGQTNPKRTESGASIGANRSSWSLRNYYRRYYWKDNYYGWEYTLQEFTAGHLSSDTGIKVVENSSLDAAKGIENTVYRRQRGQDRGEGYGHEAEYVTKVNHKVDYIYGAEKPYNIGLTRRVSGEYRTEQNNVRNVANNYGWSYSNWISSGWFNYDWNGAHGYNQIAAAKKTHDNDSYIDKAVLTDTMPPLSGSYSEEDGYRGFRPTKILVEQTLPDHIVNLTVTLKDGTKHIYTKDDLEGIADTITENGADYYVIHVYYDDDPEHTDKIADKKACDIVLHGDTSAANYITEISTVMEDINGDGDFASDIQGNSKDTYFSGNNKLLLRVYGNVNVINGQEVNGAKDGINVAKSYVVNEGGKEAGTGIYFERPALMKAFQIPLKMSTTLTSKQSQAWDYRKELEDGVTVANRPQISTYAVNFKNTGTLNNAIAGSEDTYNGADISRISFTQPMAEDFRLGSVRIPAELFDGTEWKVSEFKVQDKQGTELDVLASFKPVSADGVDYYELNLAEVFKTGDLARTNKAYNGVNYAAEQITRFTMTYAANIKDTNGNIPYAVGPTEELHAGLDDVIFMGTWVDRTQAAIDAGEWKDDTSSTPTVGKNAYVYHEDNSTTYFGARTAITVGTPTFGTAKLSVTANNAYQQDVYNRISPLDMTVKRGSEVTLTDGTKQPSFAYDEYYDTSSGISETVDAKTPVDAQHLMPGDRIAYEVTMSAAGNLTNDIPLKNPTVRFTAPQGTRIVGWEFKESSYPTDWTQQGANLGQVKAESRIEGADDLAVTAYTSASVSADPTGIVMENGQIYARETTEGLPKTNYKDMVVRTVDNRYLEVNASCKVIVYLELLDEWEGAYQGKQATPNTYMSGAYRHNYESYYVYSRGSSSRGSCADLTSGTYSEWDKSTYEIDRDAAGNKEYGVRVYSTLTYFKGTPPTLNFVYPGGEKLDQAPVVLNVTNLGNHTEHLTERQYVTLDFVKRVGDTEQEPGHKDGEGGIGEQYFMLTERPVIPNAEIYYRTAEDDGTDNPGSSLEKTDPTAGWHKLSDMKFDNPEDELEFLKSITQIRWIYSDVPAFVGDDGQTQVKHADVALTGIANYQDERKDPDSTKINGNHSTMTAHADVDYLHEHEYIEGKVLDEVRLNQFSKEEEAVFRQRPKLKSTCRHSTRRKMPLMRRTVCRIMMRFRQR